MQIIYLPKAKDDLLFWIKSGNKVILRKITDLTKSIMNLRFLALENRNSLNTSWAVYGQEELVESTDTFMKLMKKRFMCIHSKGIIKTYHHTTTNF